MKLLAVSDVEVNLLHTPSVATRFGHIDLIIGCGDLPYHYMDYLATMLNKPVYYVRGNHAHRDENNAGMRAGPMGATDLHQRVVRDSSGLLLAGIEGSLQYNFAPYQYSQNEMWMMVWGLVPRLIYNRARYGRYLDVFVTHAPPWQIHDDTDLPHQGIHAFRWLVRTFRPAVHLHGHIHVYLPGIVTETTFGVTRVINSYGYKEVTLDPLNRR